MKKHFLITALSLLYTAVLFGQTKADDVLGIWWNEEKTSRVEVFKENGKYHARVIWLKENTNPDGTSPRKDFNNEDEGLRSRNLLGVVMLKNLEWDEDDQEWENGELYDPKGGGNYGCYAEILEDGSLRLKAYVFDMPFLGKSTYCKRYVE